VVLRGCRGRSGRWRPCRPSRGRGGSPPAIAAWARRSWRARSRSSAGSFLGAAGGADAAGITGLRHGAGLDRRLLDFGDETEELSLLGGGERGGEHLALAGVQ